MTTSRDDVQRRVAPHVALAIDDAVPFLEIIPDLDDPWAVAGTSLQLVEVARMHGLLTEGTGSSPRPVAEVSKKQIKPPSPRVLMRSVS